MQSYFSSSLPQPQAPRGVRKDGMSMNKPSPRKIKAITKRSSTSPGPEPYYLSDRSKGKGALDVDALLDDMAGSVPLVKEPTNAVLKTEQAERIEHLEAANRQLKASLLEQIKRRKKEEESFLRTLITERNKSQRSLARLHMKCAKRDRLLAAWMSGQEHALEETLKLYKQGDKVGPMVKKKQKVRLVSSEEETTDAQQTEDEQEEAEEEEEQEQQQPELQHHGQQDDEHRHQQHQHEQQQHPHEEEERALEEQLQAQLQLQSSSRPLTPALHTSTQPVVPLADDTELTNAMHDIDQFIAFNNSAIDDLLSQHSGKSGKSTGTGSMPGPLPVLGPVVVSPVEDFTYDQLLAEVLKSVSSAASSSVALDDLEMSSSLVKVDAAITAIRTSSKTQTIESSSKPPGAGGQQGSELLLGGALDSDPSTSFDGSNIVFSV